MNIWILDSDSGITLLYKSHIDLMVNEDLISGLLTALNQFTVVEFKQGIESVEMAGLRWVYLEENEYNLLFIAADTKDVNSEMLKARLSVIKQSFVQEYIKSKSQWEDFWTGNIELFIPFKKVIEEYYVQWKQAESITTIAEFFDIIGVFQQVLNLTMNVINSVSQKEKIYQQIEYMFDGFKNNESIEDNSELRKISFDRESGFDIISINPNNCDFMLVEKHIIELLKGVIEIIKGEIGLPSTLNHFIQENIFDYIFNNYNLLKELNLDKFILQLLLLK